MTIQTIIKYPNSSLKEICVPVTDFDDEEFNTLVVDLLETAKVYKAQGLAANQIGGRFRVFVTRVDDKGAYKVFVNPELKLEGDIVPSKEGCLSFPGDTVLVERPEECTVTAKDVDGKEFTLFTDDVESVAIQHETDHLDGVLVTERISRFTKRYFLRKVKKHNKMYA